MKYLCIKDLNPRTYFTKGKIYNIIKLPDSESDGKIESYDDVGQRKTITFDWWYPHNEKYLLKQPEIINSNIKIL